jgi:hypothetical protein
MCLRQFSIGGASGACCEPPDPTDIHEMYAWLVATFREATEHLRVGDHSAHFLEKLPVGLPGGLGFLRLIRLLNS